MADRSIEKPTEIDWQNHITSYRSSGKSKAAYCLSEGLKLKQFEYHYRRWYETQKEEQEHSKYPQPEFTPVVVTSPSNKGIQRNRINQSVLSGSIEIQLSNGIRCTVQANFCKTTMKQLMELSL